MILNLTDISRWLIESPASLLKSNRFDAALDYASFCWLSAPERSSQMFWGIKHNGTRLTNLLSEAQEQVYGSNQPAIVLRLDHFHMIGINACACAEVVSLQGIDDPATFFQDFIVPEKYLSKITRS